MIQLLCFSLLGGSMRQHCWHYFAGGVHCCLVAISPYCEGHHAAKWLSGLLVLLCYYVSIAEKWYFMLVSLSTLNHDRLQLGLAEFLFKVVEEQLRI